MAYTFYPVNFWPAGFWPAGFWPDMEPEFVIIGESSPLGDMSFAEVTPRQGAIGLMFRLKYGRSLADATVIKIRFIKPTGAVLEVSGSIYNDLYIEYRTASAEDLDEIGHYRAIAYIESPGYSGNCGAFQFEVKGGS